MAYGRGGAGNIEASQWNAAAYAATFKQKLADDLEAQKQSPSIPPEQGPTASAPSTLSAGSAQAQTSTLPPLSSGASSGDVQRTAVTTSSAQQDYAHTGRGGAGNWYSPKALASTGTFSSSDDATPLTTSTENSTIAPGRPSQREQSTGTQHRGRGGAGNFVYSEEQLRQQHVNDGAETDQKEIELRDLVRGDVEAGLARPGKAYMAGREETDQGMNAEALRTLWS